jgi:hypothetical protein
MAYLIYKTILVFQIVILGVIIIVKPNNVNYVIQNVYHALETHKIVYLVAVMIIHTLRIIHVSKVVQLDG